MQSLISSGVIQIRPDLFPDITAPETGSRSRGDNTDNPDDPVVESGSSSSSSSQSSLFNGGRRRRQAANEIPFGTSDEFIMDAVPDEYTEMLEELFGQMEDLKVDFERFKTPFGGDPENPARTCRDLQMCHPDLADGMSMVQASAPLPLPLSHCPSLSAPLPLPIIIFPKKTTTASIMCN